MLTLAGDVHLQLTIDHRYHLLLIVQMNNRISKFSYTILVLILAVPMVYAGWAEHAAKAEKRGMSIPIYCKAKFRKSFPRITDQQYADAKEYLGGSFQHVHHLCLALIQVWGMERPGKTPDPWAARKTLKEIDYYYSRTPKNHPIMRDVHRAFSKAYRFAGDETKSKEHYEKSLTISTYKPSAVSTSKHKPIKNRKSTGKASTPSTRTIPTIPPTASATRYIEMADKMMRIGIPGEAVELLELALTIEPNSSIIKAKLKAARAAQ